MNDKMQKERRSHPTAKAVGFPAFVVSDNFPNKEFVLILKALLKAPQQQLDICRMYDITPNKLSKVINQLISEFENERDTIC